jgi:hypothetical protein
VVAMCFDLWGVRNFGATRHFFFYLYLIAQFFVLFLIAAASLPDKLDDSVNLRDYYSGNRKYFWTLITLFQFEYSCAGLYFARSEIGRYFAFGDGHFFRFDVRASRNFRSLVDF